MNKNSKVLLLSRAFLFHQTHLASPFFCKGTKPSHMRVTVKYSFEILSSQDGNLPLFFTVCIFAVL